MTCHDRCTRRQCVVLAPTPILLKGCGTCTFAPVHVRVCPRVVEYEPVSEARAAEKMGLLLEGSEIEESMSDFAILRKQARVCR